MHDTYQVRALHASSPVLSQAFMVRVLRTLLCLPSRSTHPTPRLQSTADAMVRAQGERLSLSVHVSFSLLSVSVQVPSTTGARACACRVRVFPIVALFVFFSLQVGEGRFR